MKKLSPEHKARIGENKRRYYDKPENREKRSQISKDLWQRPEFRALQDEQHLAAINPNGAGYRRKIFRPIAAKRQGHVCALCGKNETSLFVVDHNHITGKPRSMLCRICNVALAQFYEDPDFLRHVILYLETHDG